MALKTNFQGDPIILVDTKAIELYNAVLQLKDSLYYHRDYGSNIQLYDIITTIEQILDRYKGTEE